MKTDILIDDTTGDIMLTPAGDIVIGTADEQIAERVLQYHPGEFKNAPQLGARADQLIAGNNPFWNQTAKKHLQSAGIDADVRQTGDKIIVEIK